MMEAMLAIAGLMLAAASVLSLVRIVRGPGPSDRVVATDVLVAIVIGAVAIGAASTRYTYTIPVVLVLSLLAFTGTVSMARFIAGRRDLFSGGDDASNSGTGERRDGSAL